MRPRQLLHRIRVRTRSPGTPRRTGECDQRHGGEGARFALPIATHNLRPRELLAESAEGAQKWAAIASLIETCKLNSVNQHAWLALRKLVNPWPASRIDELMPWAYASADVNA